MTVPKHHLGDNFRFPAAGPQVLVHDVKIAYNQNTVSMRSGGEMAPYPMVGKATMELDFKVTLRDDSLVNQFMDYVRHFGDDRPLPGAPVSTEKELEDSRALLHTMVEAEKEMRDQLLRLSNQVTEMRKMTDSYKARNTAMERELTLLSRLATSDEAATERVAEAAVRSWVISLQEEGEFGREEILDLVKRIGLLINRVEAAKAAYFKTTDVVVDGKPVGKIVTIGEVMRELGEIHEVGKDPQLF